MAQQSEIDSLEQLLQRKSLTDTAKIKVLLRLSEFYGQVDIKESLSYSKKALKMVDATESRQNLFHSLIRVGVAFRLNASRDSALFYLQKASDIAISNDNKTNRLRANKELLALYQEARYLEEALKLSMVNLEMTKDEPDSAEKGKQYVDLANIYRRMRKFEQAITNYDKGIAIYDDVGDEGGKMSAMAQAAYAYIGLEEFEKASRNLMVSLVYFQKVDRLASIGGNYIGLGNIESVQNQHDKAVPYYLKAKELFTKTKHLALIKDLDHKLFISYSALGKRDSANAAYKRYTALKDSLDSKERKRLLAEMKTKFETEKIEAEKNTAKAEAALAKANNRIKNYLLVGLLFLLFAVAIIYNYYIKKTKAQKSAEVAAVELKQVQKQLALEKQYRDSELKALKAQMNPHFIFNSLNSIQEYVVLNKKKEASSYLQKFASLIRSYLDFSEVGAVTIREEYDTLSKYLELEKLRFEETFSYAMVIEIGVPKSGRIPTMLIQPFVENALVHGLLHKKDHRKLDIVFALVDEDKIKCTIQDNGVGREYTKELKRKVHGSFATKATKDRLELLNYRRDKKIGIEINDLYTDGGVANGTRVVLTIPLLKTIV
ncbi:hypothetical protein MTsPCn5_16640 [Croceitalea sp. MTPC5]|uniref:tetratricopeptide repeat-containing sensor histidine kinase n=1 Tax=Croceitalea sp. MTPC5 TaxID=3056565 RepID=UPI002B378D60|nr:hypothetical protein MTsPCn5_16640 [Croceitalea sp. MTPC5]